LALDLGSTGVSGTRTLVEAKKEHKLVILDLEAVWCHWCHVMEEKTYSRPDVIKAISTSFIAVKANQDAHTDFKRAISGITGGQQHHF